MKRNQTLLAVTAAIVAAGAVTWQESARGRTPDGANLVAQWHYPGSKTTGAVNAENAKTFPLQGVLSQTPDSIQKVYFFYLEKVNTGYVGTVDNSWQSNTQTTTLAALAPTDPANTAFSAGYLDAPRRESNSALMVLHQPRQTVTVELSRDPQDKSQTDIVLVVDKH